MATKKPRIAAYIPQELKECLKQFRQERGGISESEAISIILAEYFGCPEVLNPSTALLEARVSALESQMVAMKEALKVGIEIAGLPLFSHSPGVN